jgi:hypothetical protein
MKLVSRKVPNSLADETVSLLPEDPEDMVSSPCCLVPSKFIPLVCHIVFPLLSLRPCLYSYRYPSPSTVVTPSAVSGLDILLSSIYLIPHVSHFKPLSVPNPTDVNACSYEAAR